MRKKLLTALAVTAVMGACVSEAEAGFRRGGRGGGCGGSSSYTHQSYSSGGCAPCGQGSVQPGHGGGIGVPSTSGFFNPDGTPYYPSQPYYGQPGTIYSAPGNPAPPVFLPMPGSTILPGTTQPGTTQPGTVLPPIRQPGTGPSGYAPLPDTKPNTVYILDEKGQLQKAPADWQKRAQEENPLKIK
jgi:hypothetical protein